MINNRLKIRDDIIKYFQQFTRKQVDENTSINNDIGLTVSEYQDIIFYFSKKFNVDLSQMNASTFFLDETINPFKYYYYKFKKPHKLIKPALTITHLIEVVSAGYWFDPTL